MDKGGRINLIHPPFLYLIWSNHDVSNATEGVVVLFDVLYANDLGRNAEINAGQFVSRRHQRDRLLGQRKTRWCACLLEWHTTDFSTGQCVCST